MPFPQEDTVAKLDKLLHADVHARSRAPALHSFASGSDVRTLRKTAEPGLRAAALWWAEALLASQKAYKTVETVHPPARQWRLIKRRTPTGSYWLFERMSVWHRRYINQQWLDLSSILRLYHLAAGPALAHIEQECHVEKRKVPE
jgi:hypothetical protein